MNSNVKTPIVVITHHQQQQQHKIELYSKDQQNFDHFSLCNCMSQVERIHIFSCYMLVFFIVLISHWILFPSGFAQVWQWPNRCTTIEQQRQCKRTKRMNQTFSPLLGKLTCHIFRIVAYFCISCNFEQNKDIVELVTFGINGNLRPKFQFMVQEHIHKTH